MTTVLTIAAVTVREASRRRVILAVAGLTPSASTAATPGSASDPSGPTVHSSDGTSASSASVTTNSWPSVCGWTSSPSTLASNGEPSGAVSTVQRVRPSPAARTIAKPSMTCGSVSGSHQRR